MTGLLGNDVRIFVESPIPICIIFRQVTATIIITVRSPPVLEVLAGCVYTVLLGVYYFFRAKVFYLNSNAGSWASSNDTDATAVSSPIGSSHVRDYTHTRPLSTLRKHS